MKVRLLLTLAGVAISSVVSSLMAEDAMKIITPDEIVWKDDTLFKGAQYANVIGDPSKAEPCVVRVKFPPNFKIPTHTHPWSEVLTILSGAFGEATDDADKGELLKAGSVLVVPANHTHRVFTTDEGTVFQFSFMGPFDISFINPADDPRKKTQPEAKTYLPGDVVWKDGPAALPPGAKRAILEGDPGKEGFYTERLKFPDGYKIAPHTHPQTEHVTVISGTLNIGMGEKFDPSAGQAMAAGSYFFMPAGMKHFAWTTGETVIQLSRASPSDINYLNPADDPRNAKK